jgi:hypothetical protein
MTVKYTDMLPDRLYLFSGHLFCVKGGRYYRLPLDHFSVQFVPTWYSMNKYEMGAFYVAPQMGLEMADAFLENDLGSEYDC